MMLIKRAILIITLSVSYMCSGLWFHLTLVSATYLDINYKDKMQLHQSMPYSCLSEVKHRLVGGVVFLLVYLPCVICGMSSFLISLECSSRKTAGTSKRSCVFESMVCPKITSYVQSCMYSPRDLPQT